MQSEDLERVVAMLPKSLVDGLDRIADSRGLSRSALIRTTLIDWVKEQEAGAGAK